MKKNSISRVGPGQSGIKFDGIGSFLESSNFVLPATSTMFVVFRDDGSTGGATGYVCCSGVVYSKGGDNGISTTRPLGDIYSERHDSSETDPAVDAPSVVVMLDYAGSSTQGQTNVFGRVVAVSASYGPTSVISINGCYETGTSNSVGASGVGLQIGTRNNELGRFFLGIIGEVIVFPRLLNTSELNDMQLYLQAQWPSIKGRVNKNACDNGAGFVLSKQYAVTRYVQAIQSRNTIWPIKFNGMAFVAAMNEGHGEADTRQWGASK